MIVRSPAIKVVNGHDGTLVCDAENKRVFKIHEVIGKFIDEVESSEGENELTRRLEDFLLVQGGVAYNPFQIKAFVKRFVDDSVYVSKIEVEKSPTLIPITIWQRHRQGQKSNCCLAVIFPAPIVMSKPPWRDGTSCPRIKYYRSLMSLLN